MPAETSSLLWDFLSFRVLMTPALLVFIYYFGAIMAPLAVFLFFAKARQVASDLEAVPRRGRLRDSLVGRHKGKIFFAALIMFIIMEIFWRMMFEFFIAYFQIHNALMLMAPH